MRRRIYLDANADAPVLPGAWQAYLDVARQLEAAGRAQVPSASAEERYQRDLAGVAAAVGCTPDELFITSGGTEADAQALMGLCPRGAHVVTTTIEHAAVTKTLAERARRGELQVTYVPVGRSGVVDVAAMVAALRPETRLVSCVLACNETGVVQPVAELARLCRARGVLVHTDAVQGFGKIPVTRAGLGVDALSLSGHKMGAVAGVGALVVRRGVAFSPLPTQGAANFVGMASLSAACAALPTESERATLASLRDAFESALLAALPDSEVLGARAPRLPNTSCVRIPWCEGDGLVMALDLAGFSISTGSACSSGSVDPSPILLGMGLSRAEAKSTVRISLPRGIQADEVLAAAQALIDVARRMRG